PLREIRRDDIYTAQGAETNPPISVYDTSGAYGDSAAHIGLRQGLSYVRTVWLDECGGVEVLFGFFGGCGVGCVCGLGVVCLCFGWVVCLCCVGVGCGVVWFCCVCWGVVVLGVGFVVVCGCVGLGGFFGWFGCVGFLGWCVGWGFGVGVLVCFGWVVFGFVCWGVVVGCVVV
ncbi:hypothetical protein ACTHT8_12445, partial [Neisseria sp. P0021.S004]